MIHALRVIHIVMGVFWAGTVFFVVSFLMPSMKDAGPPAAGVFAGMRKRRFFEWLPVAAILNIVSGLWLYWIAMGSTTSWAASRTGMALGAGGVSALIGFTIGLAVMRPSSLRADDISRAAASLPDGVEKSTQMAEAQRLRGRAFAAARAVATLLLITVLTMAVARYL
jgi:uncharacterized membrane protein